MLQPVCKKVNSKHIKLRLLILFCISLSGCGFPIKGFYGFLGPILITGTWRILASIIIYAILLSMLATIPMYITKSFENKKIYIRYFLYWCVASLVFANLGLFLFDMEPVERGVGYWVAMVCLMFIILLPTLVPAIYQHDKKFY